MCFSAGVRLGVKHLAQCLAHSKPPFEWIERRISSLSHPYVPWQPSILGLLPLWDLSPSGSYLPRLIIVLHLEAKFFIIIMKYFCNKMKEERDVIKVKKNTEVKVIKLKGNF